MTVVSTSFLCERDMECERKGDNTKVFGLRNCKDKVAFTEIGNTINKAVLLGWGRSFLDICKNKAFGKEI